MCFPHVSGYRQTAEVSPATKIRWLKTADLLTGPVQARAADPWDRTLFDAPWQAVGSGASP